LQRDAALTKHPSAKDISFRYRFKLSAAQKKLQEQKALEMKYLNGKNLNVSRQ
jgi:hypothetical protein